jgi:hypothetical protein
MRTYPPSLPPNRVLVWSRCGLGIVARPENGALRLDSRRIDSLLAVRSQPIRRKGEKRMAFQFRLEREDGTPADPATLKAAVPERRAGDTIALGRNRMLRHASPGVPRRVR